MAGPKKKADTTFQHSPDASPVQSLGGRTYVRIFDHDGKGRQLPIGSDEVAALVDTIREHNPTHADRVVAALEVLGRHLPE